MASSAVLHALIPLAVLQLVVGPAFAAAGPGTALLLGGDNIYDFRLGAQPTGFGGNTTTTWRGSVNKWVVNGPKLNILARGGARAVKLKATGEILIAAGRTPVDFDFATQDATDPVRSAETLAKGASKWRFTSSLKQARSDHGITTIAKGNLGAMVAGGVGSGQDGPQRGFDKDIAFLKTVELYNVQTRKWSSAAAMPTSRAYFQLLKLADVNKVLAPGGRTRTIRLDERFPGGVTRTVDVYDVQKNTWSRGASLHYPRAVYAWVPTLAGGAMLIGGVGGDYTRKSNKYSEVYDPKAKTWKTTKAHILPRSDVAAALLPSRDASQPRSGKVIVIGGSLDAGYKITPTTEIWDPATNAWSAGPSLATPRAGASVTRLANGDLLVAGGFKPNRFGDSYDPVLTAEVLDAKTQKFRFAGSFKLGHFNDATLIADPFS